MGPYWGCLSLFSEEAELDSHQHEERLEKDLRMGAGMLNAAASEKCKIKDSKVTYKAYGEEGLGVQMMISQPVQW